MINLIAAIGKNNEIGQDNKLLWTQKSDMKRFKELTTNNIVIMGRKTFESIDSKPLNNRINIVLSSNKIEHPSILTYDNFNTILQFCNYHYDKQIFIIGGEKIYNSFIRYADKLFITKIDSEFKNADTFFPEIKKLYWEETILEDNKITNPELDQYPYSYITYTRIK
jgi:dihydrofolate reductase